MAYSLLKVVIVFLAMAGFGIIGSYCNRLWATEPSKGGWAAVAVPGVAAAFVVPVFLSVGASNSVFTEALTGGADFWYQLTVIAGFSILAGVSAPSFVNAVALKALRTAEDAKQNVAAVNSRTDELENSVEAAVEESENTDAPKARSAPTNSKPLLRHYVPDSAEHKILSSLLESQYTRRTIGGIVGSTGLPRAQVRESLAKLIADRKVVETKSAKTQSPLYSLSLAGEENASPPPV
ncbi:MULTISPECIES: YEATS-associated helix-containing protein [Rhizobium]|uniref:YEATS-Like-Associating Three TM domain-containing protein n=1 Tax=Rhizobium leguminosarum bv. viciae TaxID=387 RepID=A0A8G2IQH8_RHILV|nr:YEATS-associated helix-containing protein [Rhizobium leguminosarum]NKK11649.1 hypothetical protein [Rhizobium leguminosarum bv. viciae]NKK25691.1 hypothetical protein [Rhizobium leguminosarum bv. viciae]TBX84191.1 hypothetical protein E0H31_37115 [Rhizobium leguminosarum bv. viciae]TBZ07496.1 hypothetical protein E0H52_37115 [Rhizobium leguminosarum bv. viciae]